MGRVENNFVKKIFNRLENVKTKTQVKNYIIKRKAPIIPHQVSNLGHKSSLNHLTTRRNFLIFFLIFSGFFASLFVIFQIYSHTQEKKFFLTLTFT